MVQASLDEAWALDGVCNLLVDTWILHHKELKTNENAVRDLFSKPTV